MNQLDILIPFSLPPAELAADLFRELSVPSFAILLSRARSDPASSRRETFEDFCRSLPHETWLERRFGLGTDSTNTSPPIARALMPSCGLRPDTGTWFIVQPVHIHIARDHLVLTDPKQLGLAEQESRALFDIAAPLFEEAGKLLKYGNAGIWFVRADEWTDLKTATPDAASGHNIDIWMPKGAGERDWRKVQNEVQMHWFNHPINEKRESTGRKAVNSLWLWGGASAHETGPQVYSCVFNLHDWMLSFSQLAPRHADVANADELISAGSGHNLVVLDALIESALAGDWGAWLERMREIETAWCTPILQGLKAGKLDEVAFILTHDSCISQFTTNRTSLRKFWVKPSLAPLCP